MSSPETTSLKLKANKISNKILIIAIIVCFMIKKVRCYTEEINVFDKQDTQRYQVAKFDFEEVSGVYAITLWILLGSLAKIGYHVFHKVTEKFPESCLLVILGVVVGALFYATKLADQKFYVLNSTTFFLFLLPPIILEAGYFMPNRPFFDNIGTILLFAIVNTLFNTITIGMFLWGFNFTPLYGGVEFGMLDCLVFAALISAVDPVAVLATFVEINVNDTLYIIVFGESLLNDGVAVVLYRLFDAFAEMGQENILPVDIVLGLSSFFVVAIGGVLIGIIFGAFGSFTTKFTEKTPILEPLIVITISYLCYLTAESTSTSSILAITFCGMFMKQYVEFNISKKSSQTIEYVLKMGASIMETIIFMFMGLSTVSDNHSWNTGFVFLTLFACCIFRLIGVFIFANMANRGRLVKLEISDMLIMSYGGIRGAVAFALALILDENKIPRKKEFVTATIAVIFFTIIFQGSTIGALVKYLKIKRKNLQTPTMSAQLTNNLIENLMIYLEAISGVSGDHTIRKNVRNFDKKYIKPTLLRDNQSKDQKLLSTFRKINELNYDKMADSEFLIKSGGGQRTSTDPNKTDQKPKPRRLSIFPGAKPPSPNSPYREMLDQAMIKPKRRGTVFNRLQLEEDEETATKYNDLIRRASIANAIRRKSVVTEISNDLDQSEDTVENLAEVDKNKTNETQNEQKEKATNQAENFDFETKL